MTLSLKTKPDVNNASADSLGGSERWSFRRAFPLTPALSRGERENRPQPFGKPGIGVCPMSLGNPQDFRTRFPLPGPDSESGFQSEGQGEGKHTAAPCLAPTKSP